MKISAYIALTLLAFLPNKVFSQDCELDLQSLPNITVAGEEHQAVPGQSNSPVTPESLESAQVRQVLFQAAASGKIDVASEVLLSGPGVLNEWTKEARENPHIHVIESQILLELQWATNLPYLAGTENWGGNYAANRICQRIYSSPLGTQAMKSAVQNKFYQDESLSWIQEIEAKFPTSDHSGITRALDCSAITDGVSFWNGSQFDSFQFVLSYTLAYFALVRGQYSGSDLTQGIDLNYPEAPALEYMQNRSFDPNIFNARERVFFQSIHGLLCDAQVSHSQLPILILTGMDHSYGINNYLKTIGITAPTFVTYEDHRPDPETCKDATGVLREICDAPPATSTGSYLLKALGLSE